MCFVLWLEISNFLTYGKWEPGTRYTTFLWWLSPSAFAVMDIDMFLIAPWIEKVCRRLLFGQVYVLSVYKHTHVSRPHAPFQIKNTSELSTCLLFLECPNKTKESGDKRGRFLSVDSSNKHEMMQECKIYIRSVANSFMTSQPDVALSSWRKFVKNADMFSKNMLAFSIFWHSFCSCYTSFMKYLNGNVCQSFRDNNWM